MTSKVKVPDQFNNFFSSVYGDRWTGLLESLLKKEKQVPRVNLFSSGEFQYEKGEIPRGPEGLLHFYVMDPASIIAAKALQVQSGDIVLDMCAAPGGKTLVLVESLKDGGEILANELSSGRRERLKKVIQQYVPRDIRDRIWVTGKEGGKFALSHKNYFDKILIDAPCSGERHLLETPKELAEWSEKRSQKLAQRQYALLTAGLISLKPQGRMIYSTCSISPYENDQVIETLLKKKSDQFQVVDCDDFPDGAEKTKYGYLFLPDRCGFGPIFFAVLNKI